MIRCNKCGETKEDSEFPIRNGNQRHKRCKSCHKAYSKEHYAKNDAYYKKKAKKHDELVLNKFLELLKTKSCVDCGEDDPVVLDFDHCRGKKEYEVAAMVRRSMSWDKILAEIAKCDVRCSNCHRKKTARECGWKRLIAR